MSGKRRPNKPKIGYTLEERSAAALAAVLEKIKAQGRARQEKEAEYQRRCREESESMPTRPGPGRAPVERRPDLGQEAEFPYGLTRIITDETSSLPPTQEKAPVPRDPTPSTHASEKAEQESLGGLQETSPGIPEPQTTTARKSKNHWKPFKIDCVSWLGTKNSYENSKSLKWNLRYRFHPYLKERHPTLSDTDRLVPYDTFKRWMKLAIDRLRHPQK